MEKQTMETEPPMQSDCIGELAAALAKAQGAMAAAKKDSANPFFKSKYAGLAEVWGTIRGPLTDNGLAIVQQTTNNNGQLVLVTLLAHSSGQWIRSEYPVDPQKRDPQGYGSALTYARRYALSALVGVVSEEDDDGEAAMARPQSRPGIAKLSALKKSLKLDLPDDKKGIVVKYLKSKKWIKEDLSELTTEQIQRCNDGMVSLIQKAEEANNG